LGIFLPICAAASALHAVTDAAHGLDVSARLAQFFPQMLYQRVLLFIYLIQAKEK